MNNLDPFLNPYYVYSHTRPDNNEVFYIGIGTKKTKNNIYKRAYQKQGRNNIWKRIVYKNNGEFIVNILFEFSDYEQNVQKEIELIKSIGKISNGGTLANIADGGEGATGVKPSEEVKEYLSNLFGMPIVQLDLDGNFIREWSSAPKAIRELSIKYSKNISAVINGTLKSTGGFVFVRKSEYDSNKDYSTTFGSGRRVLQYSLDGKFIKEFRSVQQASTYLNKPHTGKSIAVSANDKTNKATCSKFIWKYKDDINNYEDIIIPSKPKKLSKILARYTIEQLLTELELRGYLSK